VGSTRPQRNADRVLPWLVERAGARDEFDLEVLDLRDWPLPMFAELSSLNGERPEPGYSSPVVERWNRTIADGDGYLFLTPEYNHSFPGVLKNAIESVFESWAFRNKPAAFVAYSRGLAAGIRAVEQLSLVAIDAELVPLRNTVLIARVESAFAPNGEPGDPGTERSLQLLLDDLAWWSAALRDARDRGEVPPAHLRT